MTRARWWRSALQGIVAGALPLVPWLAGGQVPDPVEVIRRVQRQDTAPDEQAQFVMQLIDAAGRVRERTGTVYERQVASGSLDKKRLIRFHFPPDIQESGVLTIEHSDRDNEQWLYLPAYHTTRRIAPANRGDRYMGTDFLYEDIMREKIEEYHYQTAGAETLDGVHCLILHAVPVAEQLTRDTAYSKKIVWVDAARDVILRVDYYDREGRFFKRLSVTAVENVAGRHRWREVRMDDFVRHHATLVSYRARRIGAGVPEQHFTQQYLRRGR